MTGREALENIKNAVEYITRLDYVDPIVRGEVKQILFDAYHKTTPEFEIIENDLEILEILRKHLTTIQITGLGTEKYKDIVVIPYEDEKDAEIVRKWLENNRNGEKYVKSKTYRKQQRN